MNLEGHHAGISYSGLQGDLKLQNYPVPPFSFASNKTCIVCRKFYFMDIKIGFNVHF